MKTANMPEELAEYFFYTDEEKRQLCNEIIKYMMDQLKEALPQEDTVDTMREVLTNSIHINNRKEQYEMSAILRDVLALINEYTEDYD